MVNIVALNSKYVHTLLAPYYLKENCEHKDKINILQLNINEKIDDIYNKIVANNPKVLAFSCYIFNINCVVELIKKIKQNLPNRIIILGGPEVSFEYDYLLPLCDFIIVGEGEDAFNNLICKLIANNYEIADIDKVILGNNKNLENIASPYSDDYFKDTNGKIAYFEASRGCPYSCAYCMSGNCGLRCFNLDYVFAELDKFKGKNIRVLKFVDRTFNAKKDFAKQILRYIIANQECFNFSFHFEVASDILDDEFIDIVNSSPKGLFQFEIGVQSFNEKTLASVVRKTNLNKVVDNIKKLISTNKSHIHTDLIAGLPYEDYESFKQGFNKLYALKSQMLQLGFLKVLKGSRLKEMLSSEYIYSDMPPYEIISTPYISETELNRLKLIEEACDKYYNSGLFKRTLDKFVSEDAFEFYLQLGKLIYGKKLSLFDRIDVLYNFLTQIYDKDLVKGLLTIDYVSTNNSRVLPKSLKFDYDKNFAKYINKIGLDKKKYFVVKIEINPVNYSKEKYLLYVDYNNGYNINYLKCEELNEN